MQVYIDRLKFARSLGMNFVRHHSHILPNEYFAAACEVGMMVSVEFPLAYGGAHAEVSPLNRAPFSDTLLAVVPRRNMRRFPCLAVERHCSPTEKFPVCI